MKHSYEYQLSIQTDKKISKKKLIEIQNKLDAQLDVLSKDKIAYDLNSKRTHKTNKKPKIKPFSLKKNQMVFHGEYSFSMVINSKYIAKDKVLRIEYQSDTPSQEDVFQYIKEKCKKLKVEKVKKVYFDAPWHFTKDGVAYGVILVFF